ncbi:MAG: hypothetical protein A2041_04985 [Bacteroidetes bacterium GWA2_31_9b]|nr:MAG: hypothetical protein A2041_04985 [Bacteroidetes bacterium GWA2_31_9b]
MKNSFYILLLIFFFSCENFLFAQEKQFYLQLFTEDQLTTDSEKQVKLYINFSGDSTQILNHLNRLIADFQNNGFISASVDSLVFDSTFVNAYVFIGKQFGWGNFEFEGLDSEIESDLKINPTSFENKTISVKEFISVKEMIITYYENHGHPFVRILTHKDLTSDSIISLTLVIDKGEYLSVDTIFIKGEAKLSRNYIYHSLNLKPGDEFSQKKINAIDKKISNIPFLSQIKPTELEFRDSGVDVYLYLKNKKANQFNGIIGFLPDSKNKNDEESSGLLITGELNLYLINSFRRGEEFLINWEKTESSTQKLNVGFTFPYLFNLLIGIDTDFDLYKKDSTFLSINWNSGILFLLSTDNYVRVYYKYKSSSLLGDKNQQISTNLSDFESRTYGVSLFYSDLDNKLNPHRGIVFNISGGFGTKSVQNVNPALDSINFSIDKNMLEFEAGLNFDIFFPIYRNFVFHYGNSTRYLDHYAENDKQAFVFENEMYRFGGAKTLRGFDENAFNASIYSIQNIELRYSFEQNSVFYLFWNGAYYYQKLMEKTVEDFPQGFGAGINFETNVGIFSLSYALGKQFDNPIEISSAKIHFGYISRF